MSDSPNRPLTKNINSDFPQLNSSPQLSKAAQKRLEADYNADQSMRDQPKARTPPSAHKPDAKLGRGVSGNAQPPALYSLHTVEALAFFSADAFTKSI